MWSHAKEFEIHGSSFTDVNGDYNHTTYLQFINIGTATGQSSSVSDGSLNDVPMYYNHHTLQREMVSTPNNDLDCSGQFSAVNTGTNVESSCGRGSAQDEQPVGFGSTACIPSESQLTLRGTPTDVPAVLDEAVRSIVDLMIVLNVNSTLGAWKQLAARWRYGGDMDDSSSMNLWLHRGIMKLLEGNSANLDAVAHIIRAANQ
ncbi:hypothetical protein L208DRAFT_1406032 [Tricholoma matsutake]|nr:hypothetical protein L208DRAFT_1406032 [Tricholoma matsutake 945]